MCVHTTIQKEENSYKTWAHTHSNYYDYLSMLGKVEWKIMSDLFCIQLWRMRSAAANKGRFGSCGALARVQSSFTSYWMAPAVQSLKRILKALKDSCPAPLPHLPGWEGMRGVNCKLMLYSGFFPCPLSIFLEKYIFPNTKRRSYTWDSQQVRCDTSHPNAGRMLLQVWSRFCWQSVARGMCCITAWFCYSPA